MKLLRAAPHSRILFSKLPQVFWQSAGRCLDYQALGFLKLKDMILAMSNCKIEVETPGAELVCLSSESHLAQAAGASHKFDESSLHDMFRTLVALDHRFCQSTWPVSRAKLGVSGEMLFKMSRGGYVKVKGGTTLVWNITRIRAAIAQLPVALGRVSDQVTKREFVDPLVYLTATCSPGQFEGDKSTPHPAISDSIRAAGTGGIGIITLKIQLDRSLGLPRTVKTKYLENYLRLFWHFEFDGQGRVRSCGDEQSYASAFPVLPAALSSPAAEDEMRSLLMSVGLGQLLPVLLQQEVDMEVLTLMDDEDFEHLGMSSYEVCKLRRAVIPDISDTKPAATDSDSSEDASPRSEVAKLKAQVVRLEAQNAELKAQLSARDSALLCQICMARPRDIVILPCAHTMYCATCVSGTAAGPSLTHCPSCQVPIAGELKCQMSPAR